MSANDHPFNGFLAGFEEDGDEVDKTAA